MAHYELCLSRSRFFEDLPMANYSTSTCKKSAMYIVEGQTPQEKDARAETLHRLLKQSKTEQEFLEKMGMLSGANLSGTDI